MRNIPVFTTENGVASLILKEIPYRSTAYIKIQDTSEPIAFLKECCDFCRGLGAAKIFASGKGLDAYPLHTSVCMLQRKREDFPVTDALLVPVQRETLEHWRQIYNQRMENVPNSSYMTVFDGEKMLQDKNGYFAYRNDELIGIGMASGSRIYAVASVVSGTGQDVLAALNSVLTGQMIEVEAATANIPAMRLYTRLGFSQVAELSRWCRIL